MFFAGSDHKLSGLLRSNGGNDLTDEFVQKFGSSLVFLCSIVEI